MARNLVHEINVLKRFMENGKSLEDSNTQLGDFES